MAETRLVALLDPGIHRANTSMPDTAQTTTYMLYRPSLSATSPVPNRPKKVWKN
jgi:hypothetical protein